MADHAPVTVTVTTDTLLLSYQQFWDCRRHLGERALT
ncbi:hypothetical protein FHR38_000879 [Micromonospora polyrhachis]|uniref:Uncharacterized protein n=1 Tax=Micromonospora polyrhachis TaxID=1282883 RepID=A0A7W7SME0_9ACTN|nr:hypothetical protein [Micromonospora polyrhachis]